MRMTVEAGSAITGLRALADRITNGVARQKRAAASETLRALIETTPVDTGRAKGNWLVGINAPPTSYLAAGQGNPAAGFSVIQAAGRSDVIYLVNNAPYIGALNRGRSPQAQAGFIEAAVERGRIVARNVKITGG